MGRKEPFPDGNYDNISASLRHKPRLLNITMGNFQQLAKGDRHAAIL
jgi:hypothetical protein